MLPKTRGFVVRVQVKHATGTGFAGMGVGWTLPTRAVPVCHPSHTATKIHHCWLTAINKRLQLDCILTNYKQYGRKALPPPLVQQTWKGTLQDESGLPDDWYSTSGVLVDIGSPCPPGHNC